MEYVSSTTSTCPVCRALIGAKILAHDGKILMRKQCPRHGAFEVFLRDRAAQENLLAFHRRGLTPRSFQTKVSRGCPLDCGLCPEHEQHVCMPIIEITDHCDLNCPVCLVRNRNSFNLAPAQLDRMLDGLIESECQIDVLNLSGGEPTLHPDFREIVDRCLGRKEILRVAVSTNGIRLAGDASLMKFLAERDVVVSLQYDGEDDGVYGELRGRPLAALKQKVLERSFRLNSPVSLAATIVRDVNEKELNGIVNLFFARENILSLMLQPAAFVGNGTEFRRGRPRRVTVPELVGLMGEVSVRGAGIRASDFSPLPCSHPECYALAFFLRVGPGEYQAVKRLVEIDRYLDIVANRALVGVDASNFEKIRAAVYDLWSGPAGSNPDSQRALDAVRELFCRIGSCGCFDGRNVMKIAERSLKSVFIHGFMDAETFDLSRVRKCCNVYPLSDGRLMPACVYNVLERPR